MGEERLGIVGVGAIAEAIVTGICAGEHAPPVIHVSPRSAARVSRLAARHPSVRVAGSNQAVVAQADVVLVCVRPQDGPAVLRDLAFRLPQAVISVMAGVRLEALRRWVAPAEAIVRAIPLPAVARRQGVTAMYPPHARAREIFGRLGGVVELADERALDALSASTATIATHFAYLDAISGWLTDQGIRRDHATRYVAAVFGNLSATLLDPGEIGFAALAREYATRGGINEQFLAALRRAGTFQLVAEALDDVARRLAG